MVCRKQGEALKELKVANTNVNGILSTRKELNGFLRENKPDTKGVTKYKLSDEVTAVNIDEVQHVDEE